MPRDLVALVPIKGHSERVPGKNFRPLVGKPLCGWILDTLLAMDEVDLVVVNTDARDRLWECGYRDSPRLLIRDRRPEIRGDMVSMNLVLADDVAAVDAGAYLMTHATNPLLSAATIRRALGEFARARAAGTADSLFSVNRFQSRFYRADGRPLNHDPARLERTQDLEPWFEENSLLYLFTEESFHEAGARIGRRPMMFETPRMESIDIDDDAAWSLAEIVAASGRSGVESPARKPRSRGEP